uniref:Tetratricopeptide repeat-containing protein n=1 Tax=Candidatus Kentrum eta TaxID=2126337 RepID=A0A450USB7_9GAMM|nr:MAG: hypothetical protein BECKH772A_GA0070896_1000113 [Candidatus Kentron sp. H]VFJ88160.1 MAG: hypothetical protein BECKH772B_GA0070898_100014 [Candidatus Kentron sp. H]VFJ95385.1 MAG: hypothetical protein BECKH772C_GA0070978_1000213 [Candidatus Kentron sp. H]
MAALRNANALDAAQRAAEAALKRGETQAADALFAELETAGSKKAAQAAKYRGAIAYMNAPQAALAHYQRAVGYAPEDRDAWNRVGVLNWRLGDIGAAEAAWARVRALGEQAGDRETEAIALGNLGLIARTRGEPDKAEEGREPIYVQALGLRG